MERAQVSTRQGPQWLFGPLSGEESASAAGTAFRRTGPVPAPRVALGRVCSAVGQGPHRAALCLGQGGVFAAQMEQTHPPCRAPHGPLLVQSSQEPQEIDRVLGPHCADGGTQPWGDQDTNAGLSSCRAPQRSAQSPGSHFLPWAAAPGVVLLAGAGETRQEAVGSLSPRAQDQDSARVPVHSWMPPGCFRGRAMALMSVPLSHAARDSGTWLAGDRCVSPAARRLPG